MFSKFELKNLNFYIYNIFKINKNKIILNNVYIYVFLIYIYVYKISILISQSKILIWKFSKVWIFKLSEICLIFFNW